MTQISSLNLTIQRIQSIEQRFNVLEGIQPQRKPDTDFEEILNATMNDVQENNNNNISSTHSIIDEKIMKPVSNSMVSREKIDNLIEKYAIKNNLDKDFVKAVIKQESGFQTRAKSHCGAMGLMQLMPQTAMSMGVNDAYDAEQNIAGGTKYLSNLLSQYNGNKEYALAAYNAGPNAVKRYGGIPPYKETQNYVKNVIANYNNYKECEI